jgi:endo-1,4-beta-mannosidase
MLRLQTNHAAEFARRYRGESAILAWDLTDEPPYWIVADQTNDAMAVNWTRLIAGALRRYDPEHPLCVGTSMEDIAHGPFRPDNLLEEVDFFSAHPYSIYEMKLFPDPFLSERGTYCGAFQTLLSGGAGKPVMIHEDGASNAQYGSDRIAVHDRVTLYSSLAAGTNGFLMWCYTDAAPELFHQAPYLLAPHETQFGMTTWKRQDRPRGVEFKKFCQIINQMDLSGIEPARAEAAVIVPHEWAKPLGDYSRSGLGGPSIMPYESTQEAGTKFAQPGYHSRDENHWLNGAWLNTLILLRRAGLKAAFPREYADWQNYPLLFLPSPLTSTTFNMVHVHSNFWEKAGKYIQNGGAMYLSFCADAAIPEMERLFGARLVDHRPAQQVTLTLTKDFGGLVSGESFTYSAQDSNPNHWPALIELAGGEVIAVDQDGNPAFVAHSYGKGKTLLSAYPIESYLAIQPSAFENAEKTHRLYQAFRQWAGVEPLFQTNQPSVEIAGLIGNGHGYAVLANHASQELSVRVTTSLFLQSIQQVTVDGLKPLKLTGNQWEMKVAPFDGAIVAWILNCEKEADE